MCPYRGVEQLVARRAHNPEVVGSSPSPATRKRNAIHLDGVSFLRSVRDMVRISRVMRPTSAARWVSEPTAACGGSREANAAQRSKKARKSESPKLFSGTASRRKAITRRSLVQVLPPQPKKFLGLVPRIFFYLFTLHSSLFTFLPPQRNFFGSNK